MRQLSSLTNRAIDLDVTVRADLTLEGAGDLLLTVTASKYEAIVVFVGVQDALDFASPTTWGEELRHMLESITDSPTAPEIVFVAIPPVSRILTLPFPLRTRVDRHADMLNQAARAVMADAGTFVPFIPDEAEEALRHRSPETYERWAEQIARPIGDSLCRSRREDTSADEGLRQAALDRLAILDTPPEEAFDRIMLLARDLFGTAAAAITFIDRDRQWFKSRAGFEATETAREDAFCDHTIRQGGPFVVCDATLDARFVDNRFVNDQNHLRFYAGYPLEGEDGERIGALCIFDTVPRSFDGRDKKLLRSLALLVQEQLGRAAIAALPEVEGKDALEPQVKGHNLAGSALRGLWPHRATPA
ncbi:GAF domain-containing protein [Lacisediminihabitans sp. FW035]